MNKVLLAISLLVFTTRSYSQDTIDVVEKTIKIGGLSRETEYYGFAEGDRVIFNLTIDNKKELKDITISEYPSSVKFADHTVQSVQNKVLNVARKGIFSFEYYNSNMSGRTAVIKIQRIPKTEATKFFNTNVKWINIVDTTYTAKPVQRLISSDTSFEEVTDAKVRVHSQSNLSNPNRTLVDFILPANTVKWTYWIGVGNEAQEAFNKDRTKLIGLGAKVFGSTNPLAGLALGLISMSQASVGDNVHYYFIPSYIDAYNFTSKNTFKQFKQGNVVTDFGLMNFSTVTNEKLYVGFVNDNAMQGIDVNLKIVALVVINKYTTTTENVATYTNKIIPIHEE